MLIVLSVRRGLRKVEVTLVFQRFGRGTVDDPVFMELVKVLGASSATMSAARPPVTHTTVQASHDEQRGGGNLRSLSYLCGASCRRSCGHAS